MVLMSDSCCLEYVQNSRQKEVIIRYHDFSIVLAVIYITYDVFQCSYRLIFLVLQKMYKLGSVKKAIVEIHTYFNTISINVITYLICLYSAQE